MKQNKITATVDSDGTKYWKNDKGQLHREDGPALVKFRGLMPETKKWYLNDKLHRTDGPALECWHATEWYLNGKLHREDGPASIWHCGSKFWYQYGKYHRVDGPAHIWSDGSKMWCLEGKPHRTDGPAVDYPKSKNYPNGVKQWFIKGRKLSKEEFLALKNPTETYISPFTGDRT